jgi:hypothetical protein
MLSSQRKGTGIGYLYPNWAVSVKKSIRYKYRSTSRLLLEYERTGVCMFTLSCAFVTVMPISKIVAAFNMSKDLLVVEVKNCTDQCAI